MNGLHEKYGERMGDMRKNISQKIVSFLLIILMVVSGITFSRTEAEAATGYDRGYVGGRYGNNSSTVYAYGVDVSSWQGYYLDFNKLNKDSSDKCLH